MTVSSLHGMIAADSYGIPSIWIKFPDHGLNDDFKYQDYLLSVGKDPRALTVCSDPRMRDFDGFLSDKMPTLNVSKLIKACPFLSPDVAQSLNPEWVFTRP